ncbi:hypothetical protein EDF66_11941 [Sphingobacterium sp. JUb20]|nr:hypothetical protein EDF66_11941 [Sphingobacterium sp. JUb20]
MKIIKKFLEVAKYGWYKYLNNTDQGKITAFSQRICLMSLMVLPMTR